MTRTFRIPDELYRRLRDEAKKSGQSVNGYLLTILWRTLQGGEWNEENTT